MDDSKRSGCLFAVLDLVGLAPRADVKLKALPYRRKDYLFTEAERSFYGVLNNAVGGEYLIFAKIRLADLLYLPKGTEKRQSFFNRIQSKHIDFVICDQANVRPLLVIELDDKSHSRPDRISRDKFVDEALKAAGLPLLRVPARRAYQVEELREELRRTVSASGS